MARAVLASVVLATEGQGAEDSPVPGRRIVEHLDLDGDGFLDLKEYVGAAQGYIERRGGTSKEEQGRILDFHTGLHMAADANGDGLLSAREADLAEALASWYRGEFGGVWQEAEAGERPHVADFAAQFAGHLIAQHDVDGNGKLSRAEYTRAMLDTLSLWGVEAALTDPDVVEWMDRTFDKANLDDDAFLNPTEALFVSLLAQQAHDSRLFDAKTLTHILLRDLDKNSDGEIDRWEVSACVGGDPAEPGKITHAAHVIDSIDAHFDRADSNKNGRLDEAEALALARAILVDLDR